VRARAATYFPSDYTVFVRLSFSVDDHAAKVTLWIDDPNVRWPNGLFARRAWKLSVPIMTHIVKDIFDSRLRSIRFDVNERKARVGAFAPTRGWTDPVILSGIVALATTFYWLVLHHWLWTWLTRY
jgi:hypothetical protein